MLKKIGAVLLAVGLFLPYTPGNRIVTGLFQDIPTILFQGVPVLITIAYVLHSFVPPLAQFHQRYGQGLHGLFRVVFFVLAGGYLAMSLAKEHGGGRRPCMCSSRSRSRVPCSTGDRGAAPRRSGCRSCCSSARASPRSRISSTQRTRAS